MCQMLNFFRSADASALRPLALTMTPFVLHLNK